MNADDFNQKLITALKLQQDDKLEEAQTLFEAILAHDPNHGDALHGLGLLYAQRRDFHQAIVWLQKAVAAAPHVPAFHNNLGNAYKAIGAANPALMHYREALKLKTPYPEVRNNLGRMLFQQGLIDEAVEELKKAIREDPELVDAHYNLANCYIKIDRFLDAKAHFQEVLKLRADHFGATYNLAMTLIALKDFKEAHPLLVHAVEREPNNIDALFHLGLIEGALGNTAKALEIYQKVITLNPDHSDTHHNIATLLLQKNQKKEALEHYHKAYTLNPNNRIAKHMIDSLEGKASSEGAPLEFVQSLFDQYAYNYNHHVKDVLEYKVPMLLREAISSEATAKSTPWKVLDLGCGTGLCAPYFRDLADTLIGIDLSSNMIAMAQAQGGYDKLIVSDAHTYLDRTEEMFDLILAADVLIYFGDLTDLFASCARHIKPSGHFIFSLEKNEGPEDYCLKSTGRYGHSQKMIENLAARFYFIVKKLEVKPLRKHEDQWISGYIVVLQKNGVGSLDGASFLV